MMERNTRDWRDWDLFDKVTIEGNNPDRSYRLFTFPVGYLPKGATVGSNTQVKDDTDTNMWQCCQLPAPCEFVIENLIVHANRDMTGRDVAYADKVWSKYALRLYLMQKCLFHTPLTRFPMSPDYRQIWFEGKQKWILPRPVRFTQKIVIPYNMYFYVELIKSNKDKDYGVGKVDVTVTLNGKMGFGGQ